MSTIEVSPFHYIMLYKLTLTHLLSKLTQNHDSIIVH